MRDPQSKSTPSSDTALVVATKNAPLDTEQLKQTLAAKKAAGEEILERASQLKYLARHRKTETLLRQHRVLWAQHYGHLRTTEGRLQREVYSHVVLFGQLCPDGDALLTDVLAEILDLEDDRALFKDNVVDPLWHLREDLQAWIRHYRESRPLREHLRLHHHHVHEEVQAVWLRYQDMAHILEQELAEIESSLPSLKELLGEDGGGTKGSILKGIPLEFQELWCPDPKQKDSLVQELHRIDDNYRARLKDIDLAAEKQPRPPGWTDDDVALFQLVIEQYPSDLNDRRVLLFDRLKRTFPSKALSHLMTFEGWLQGQRFHKDRRHKCLEDWTRERWAWLLRAVGAIQASQQAHESRQASRHEATVQRQLCHQLRMKVEEWRKDRDAERRKQALAERQRQAALKLAQQSQAAREERRRLLARHKLKAHYEARLVQQKQSEEALRRRLEEMKQIAKVRAVHDKERVRYRTQLFYQQLQDRQARRLKLREELRIRELKLEALRKKVRVEAERDPDRLLQDTASSQARQEAEDAISAPFLPLFSFTAEEIARDPRIRLESHLREAGLLNSEYARQVIHSLRPLRHHRRDMVPSLEAPSSPSHTVGVGPPHRSPSTHR